MTLREIIYRAHIEHRRTVDRTQIHKFLKLSQGMFGANNRHKEAIQNYNTRISSLGVGHVSINHIMAVYRVPITNFLSWSKLGLEPIPHS